MKRAKQSKLLALLLAVVMMFGMLPTAAFAEDGAPETEPVVMEAPTAESAAPAAVEPAEEPTEEPAEEPTEEPAEEPTEEPAPEKTAEEQLAEMIAALPAPEKIDPQDEAQVEDIGKQISAIKAFAEENSIDVEDNETLNAVIAAAWPAETTEDNSVSTETELIAAINTADGTRENPTVINISSSITLTQTLRFDGKNIKLLGVGNDITIALSENGSFDKDIFFLNKLNGATTTLIIENLTIDGENGVGHRLIGGHGSGGDDNVTVVLEEKAGEQTIIRGCPPKSFFGATFFVSGKFEMNGGTVYSCGCGIYITTDSTFSMRGGTVIGTTPGSNNKNYGPFYGEWQDRELLEITGGTIIGSGTTYGTIASYIDTVRVTGGELITNYDDKTRTAVWSNLRILEIGGDARIINKSSTGKIIPSNSYTQVISALSENARIDCSIILDERERAVAAGKDYTLTTTDLKAFHLETEDGALYIDSKNNLIRICEAATVTFIDNTGGSAETKTQKVPKSHEAKLDANTFTRTGYTFQNWSTEQNGGGTTYQDKADITTDTDVTLYAQWKANEYTITHELNGGTAGTNPPSKHTYGKKTTLVNPTRTDYVFGGWFTSKDFSGSKVTSLGATDYTDNITLYALWTKQISSSYTVDAIPDQTYTGKAIVPQVVVRNNGTLVTSGYTVTCADNSNIDVSESVTATVAIGSVSGQVPFKITKDEHPTVEMADVSVTYGEEYTMTATAKTNAGNEITNGTITIMYYTNEGCTEGEMNSAPTAAGEYWAKAVLTQTSNYAEASKIAKITISKADFKVTATGYDGVYDGQAHSIKVTAGEGVTVTYSETENGTYGENPTFTNAGTYTVYYKASKANHNDVTGSVTVNISKAEQAISFTSAALTAHITDTTAKNALTQTTVAGAVTYISSNADVATVGADGKVTINGVGEATITATAAATDNYNEATASYTLTVTDHSYGKDWTSDNANHWHACTVCGDKKDNAAHDWKWIIDKEVTATENGSKHQECSVCDYELPAVEIPTVGAESSTQTQVIIKNLSENDLSNAIKNKYSTVAGVEKALKDTAVEKGFTAANTVVKDVKLQYKDKDGNWVDATAENFPKEGITIKLDYPAGTGKNTHDFLVVHMMENGEIETPAVTEKSDGIYVTLHGLSPVSVSWKATSTSTNDSGKPASTSPQTGDSSNIALWSALLAVSLLGFGVMLLAWKKKSYRGKWEK